MASLDKIAKFLDKELRIKKIKDSSKNGLQVKAKNDIKKIGFAVDGCLSTFEKAKKADVDLLVVHHGIKWRPQKYKELTEARTLFLKKNKIALYGAHLPLDAHKDYGNNIGLCRVLQLKEIKKFGKYHGASIGFKGKFRKNKSLKDIANILNKKLKTRCKIYAFGKTNIKTIGVVSGGGSDSIEDAVKDKMDCFLLGELSLGAYHRAKDYNQSMIAAGHYATEIVGVQLLMPLIKKKFNIETIFIDNPTGI